MIALLVLANSEYLSPIATKKMNYIFKVKVQGNQPYGDTYILKDFSAKQLWFIAKDTAVWNIGQFDPKEMRIRDAKIFYRFDNGSIQKRIDVKEVVWSGAHWEFFDGFQMML